MIQNLPTKNTLRKIQKSLLNLHFKAPQSRGPFQIDRKYQKIRACKIWWVLVRYTSSYGQKCCCFYKKNVIVRILCFSPIFGFPVLVNPSKVIFSIINYIQNIYCIAICAESTISDNIKKIKKMFVLHLFSTCMYYIYLLLSYITSIYYMYVLRLFINFFDSAVPAGACRALFLRKFFFKHHVLTPDSESTQKFVKKCTYSSSGGALCVKLRVLKGKIRILVPMS